MLIGKVLIVLLNQTTTLPETIVRKPNMAHILNNNVAPSAFY